MKTKTIKKVERHKRVNRVRRERAPEVIHDLWDLPKLAVKTGDKYLSQRVDEIVYGR